MQLLRTGTGYDGPPFDGPVFTDDLSSMGAINGPLQRARRGAEALQAGTDIALWVTTDEVPAVLDRLEEAVAAGELTMQASTRRCCGSRSSRAPSPTADRNSAVRPRIAYAGVPTGECR